MHPIVTKVVKFFVLRFFQAAYLEPSAVGDRTIKGFGDVADLPATVEDGTINSVWRVKGVRARLAFLLRGEITLRVWGRQPPVALAVGRPEGLGL